MMEAKKLVLEGICQYWLVKARFRASRASTTAVFGQLTGVGGVTDTDMGACSDKQWT
jgi:hypothetical protein